MKKIFYILIAILALGLPINGGISVFLPEIFRWWKELILIILFFLVITDFVRNLGNNTKYIDSRLRENDTGNNKSRIKSLLAFNLKILTQPTTWAFCFLVWGGFLVLVHGDLNTGLIALRYLGLGFFAFMLCFLLCKSGLKSEQNGDDFIYKILHIFCTFFIVGVLISVLFGLWAQWGGGFEIVQNFYASTISSWVPGQTLPLYHEAGGVVRMQGLSSGPIELAHLCLLALVCIFYELRKKKEEKRKKVLSIFYYFAACLLLIGIYFTASRAVELVLILCGLAFLLKPFWKTIFTWWSYEKFVILLLISSLFLGGIKFGLTSDWAKENKFLSQKVDMRGGTMDHFTRPVEALRSGSKTLIIGQLGQWGPAARIKNLKENNDDRASITENIFADWFVQLGLLGFLFGMLFFVSLGWQFLQTKKYLGIFILLVFFIPMNLATIFDMTPISLSFFIFLALLLAFPAKIRQRK